MWCSVYQWMISSALDSEKRLGRWTSRHIARCDDCRRFWEASARLEERLRTDAPQAAPALAPLRVGSALAGARRSGLRKRPLILRPAFLIPTAAVAILVVAFFMLSGDRKPMMPKDDIVKEPRPVELPEVAALVDQSLTAERLVISLNEAGCAVFVEEMENLVRDARAGAGVLLAYLPLDFRPGAEVEP